MIGWVGTTSPRPMETALSAFRRGLNEIGYFERQNVAIEYRWARRSTQSNTCTRGRTGRPEVAVIVAANGTGPARAAKAATATIPIIFVYGGDPVRMGLVASLDRPGGNVTGVTFSSRSWSANDWICHGLWYLKRKRSRSCRGPQVLFRMTSRKVPCRRMRAHSGFGSLWWNVGSDRDFEMAFATLIESQAAALIVGTFPFDKCTKLCCSRHGTRYQQYILGAAS